MKIWTDKTRFNGQILNKSQISNSWSYPEKSIIRNWKVMVLL